MKESESTNNQSPSPDPEVLQKWASFYDNMGDNDTAKEFMDLSQTEQKTEPSEEQKEFPQGQELQEQLEAFYENMGDSKSAAQLRESSPIESATGPQSESIKTTDSSDEKPDYDMLFLRKKFDGTLPEGVTDAYELRYYMEEQAARAAEAKKNGFKDAADENADVNATDEANNAEKTDFDVRDIPEVVMPEVKPAPENEPEIQPEPEAQASDESAEATKNPEKEQIEARLAAEKKELEQVKEEARRYDQTLKEIYRLRVRETESHQEAAQATQQRGRKVMEALSQRRVALAQRRADHARVKTFDPSYESSEPASEPAADTLEPEAKGPTRIEVTEPKPEPKAQASDESAETAPTSREQILARKAAHEAQLEQAKEEAKRYKEKYAAYLKDDVKALADQGTVQEDSFNPEEYGSLSKEQYNNIIANSFLEAKLNSMSDEQLQSEFDDYSKKARILSIILKQRKNELVDANESQILSENTNLVQEFDQQSTEELMLRYRENQDLAHHIELKLNGRARRGSQEAAA